MIDYIVGPFQYPFMLRALIVSVLVGFLLPVVGAYIITRGRAFMSDALAHSLVAPVAVAALLGFTSYITAVPGGVAIALLMGYLSRQTGHQRRHLYRTWTLTPGQSISIEDLLLGQVLAVSQTDVLVTLVLTIAVAVGVYLFHRQLVFTTFDPVGASVVGIRTGIVEYVLLALLALVIVSGLQAAGIVLVMAMLVIPSATAYLLARRFVGVILVGAAIGVISAIAGLYLSYYANWPSGPAMALVAATVFGAATLHKRTFTVRADE
ncbi:Manganese transport system membrane protein MntC [Geodia barretti]|uniref:Manganese transport system membrane protein MntC n=1 Tax=Geodia barretti TaxID=519541 RepID=A0AA35RFD4_GEOBA|nr:Manganese transport system membrane protein MntC [Geodia barretti]